MQIEDCESKMQDKDIEAIHLLMYKNRKVCMEIKKRESFYWNME